MNLSMLLFFIRNCFRFFYQFLLAFNTDYTTLGRFTVFLFPEHNFALVCWIYCSTKIKLNFTLSVLFKIILSFQVFERSISIKTFQKVYISSQRHDRVSVFICKMNRLKLNSFYWIRFLPSHWYIRPPVFIRKCWKLILLRC